MGVRRERVERAEEHLVALAAVGALLDPAPSEAIEAAVGSFAWRSIDAELADLVFDSAGNRPERVGIRSRRASRQLTFEAPHLVVELEVDAGADGALVGQLVPAGSAEVEIRSPSATMTVDADERGRFWGHRFPGRVVSLRIRRPANGIGWVTTPWVSLLSCAPR